MKEDYKARTGWSPDRADCYVMGLDALDKARTVEVDLRMRGRPKNVLAMHPVYYQDQSRNPYAGRALPESEWNKLQVSRR